MSEIHPIQNHQEEQSQVENQQQNVDIQEHPVEQTNQDNKRQLTVETNLQQPTSPIQGDGQQIILSPKTDASQRVMKEQSPALLKGKLDILRNLYNTKEKEFKQIDKSGFQKQKQLQNVKTALADAQRQEAQKVNNAAQKVGEKNQIISELESRLNNIKSDDIALLHSQKVVKLNAEIANANQKLHQRESKGKNQIIQAKISEKINSLTQNTQSLKAKKDQVLTLVNDKRQKLSNERSNLQQLLNKLIQSTKGDNSFKLSELESRQKAIEQEIQTRKQQINKLREEIESSKHSGSQSTFQAPDLSELKTAVEDAKREKTKIENEIEAQQKQFKDVVNKNKSFESTIENKKSKNTQLNEKVKKLQEQKNKLEKEVHEGQKKKPKFEQKVPEQLLALRVRKAELQKEVKQQIEKTDKQRNKEDNLVPASVIKNMNEKIVNIKEKNELYGKLIVENNNLRQENIKLDATKQGLWETSTQVKIAVSNVEKEQAKHDVLDRQVTQFRAKNVQIANKLEEYIHQYPDFKPQKKQKKSQPAQTQPQGKKQVQQVKKEAQQTTEQKGGKKKKNNKSSPEASQVFVPEVEEEKPSPVIPQQKQVEKKEEQKAGKGKNKSKKQQKQAEEPSVQKKEEPAKKQEPVPKVEAPKKEQTVKKEEPKVENKPAQGGQGNKNKKKR